MGSLFHFIKNLSQHAPPLVARIVPHVPFSVRLGPTYKKMRHEISEFNQFANSEKKDWLFKRMQKIVGFAYENIPFYRDYYQEQNFRPEMLVEWEDLQRIPIVTRAELQQVPIEQRSLTSAGQMQLNTGGTSGQPLTFLVDRHAFAREWAHMHSIWETVDYHRTDMKITLRGKHHGKKAVIYNPIHNELSVNAFVGKKEVADALAIYLKKYNIKYIHGYPSAIYDFLRYLQESKHAALEVLKSSVKAVFLASEYPAPIYRDYIKKSLSAKTLSWYGHSEMAILAGEKLEDEFVYHPMHTYGYCEAVEGEQGHFRLIGTSIHNQVGPFIRYDSGDFIEPNIEDDLLSTFRIKEGRVGEFVVDRKGQRLTLTALIFGRHHELFSWARFVQVGQREQGKVDIYVTTDESLGKLPEDAQAGFDYAGVDLDFRFILRANPIRTQAGKTPLLITEKLLVENS